MRRRFWVGIGIVPLLLVMTLLWARGRSWEKLEEEFRTELLASATSSADTSFTVSFEATNRTLKLGDWTPVQLKAVLADVHLQKRSISSVARHNAWLRFVVSTRAPRAPDPTGGFYALPGANVGLIGWVRSWPQFNDKWGQFEISPESSRMLERRLWTLVEPKLRLLHDPTPQ